MTFSRTPLAKPSSAVSSSPPSGSGDADDAERVPRRDMAALFGGALGALTLVACGREGGASGFETSAQTSSALTGTAFVWADTIGTPATPGALRSLVGSDTVRVALVGGFWSSADGGGGAFFWDPNSTEADDAGTIVNPTGNTTGRWKRIYSGDVNVKWFGARGDGVTPDDAAIQAAIKAATGFDRAAPATPASRHGTIFLPLGNYLVSQTLLYVGGAGSQFGMRGQIGSGFGSSVPGTAGAFSTSGTVLTWSASASPPSYDSFGNPTSGVLMEFRGFARGFVENVDFDGNMKAGVSVWFHSNQPNGGAGSDGCVFRNCSFLNVVGGPHSVLFLVGEAPNQFQTDNTAWEDCLFDALQVGNTIVAAACWKTANAGNIKNFAFWNCSFSGAMYGIDWGLASGHLLVDGGGFGKIGRPAWAQAGQVAAFLRIGPNGTTVVRNCETEQPANAQSNFDNLNPGGVQFITSDGGGSSLTSTTLTVEGCTVYLTMPPTNVIIDFPGKMTLIGNDFFAGFGSDSANQNAPQIACTSAVGFNSGNTAPVAIFSLNNTFPGLPFGSYAPFVVFGGGQTPLPLTGPGSWGGVTRNNVWSMGDTSISADGTRGIALRPWIGLLPEAGPSLKGVAPQWSVNPVPNGAAATWVLMNWAGSAAGTLAVGDVVIVSCDGPLPPGVSLTAAVTAPNQVAVTAMNLSGSPQTLSGNLNLTGWPRTTT